jgi:hypothetical protein
MPAKRTAYPALLRDITALLEEARRASARTVNVIMTATYWQIGPHIVEHEQAGEHRAGYGDQLIGRLSTDLTRRFRRGFSADNLETMRLFYMAYLDARRISETPSRKFSLALIADALRFLSVAPRRPGAPSNSAAP